MLSRNFRLQQVGDLNWLKNNYVFSKISHSIDELIVLNVSKGRKNDELFKSHLNKLAEDCFIPIAAGGGIRSVEQSRELLRSGADKVVLNTPVFNDPNLVYKIYREFGQQCIVASVDVKKENDSFHVYVENGMKKIEISFEECLNKLINLPIGEIYLNSIDRDGTGQGYMMDIINYFPDNITIPIIMAGGAGKYNHLSEGIKNKKIDAVATANLFNFIGNGLEKARKGIVKDGVILPKWDLEALRSLKLSFNSSL